MDFWISQTFKLALASRRSQMGDMGEPERCTNVAGIEELELGKIYGKIHGKNSPFKKLGKSLRNLRESYITISYHWLPLITISYH